MSTSCEFQAEMERHADVVRGFLYSRGDSHDQAARSIWALLGYFDGHKSPAASDVLHERVNQDRKWGEQNHDPFVYGAILAEEMGEFMQAALKARFESASEASRSLRMQDVRAEAVQCAAVALAIVECLDRGKWTWGGHAVAAGESA